MGRRLFIIVKLQTDEGRNMQGDRLNLPLKKAWKEDKRQEENRN